MDEHRTERARWNAARWPRDGGHYESWFLRANHPTRGQAFWIRYTIFAPAAAPEAACGELWAIWFDGDADRVVAVRSEHPIAQCRFDTDGLGVAIADATLEPGRLRGACTLADRRLGWDLSYEVAGPPLLLLPESLYQGGLPKAKSVVAAPLCRFTGAIDVAGERVEIDRWLGSQNHNWGPRHTDRYAWGQVAGFDGHDDALLECITAKLRFGPLWTPWLTIAVLRVGDETFAFNRLARAPFGSAHLAQLQWRFAIGNGRERLTAAFAGQRADFVGLNYRNPPGGTKICLNSKIAQCSCTLVRAGRPALELHTARRAAFELLGDDAQGIGVVA